MSVPPPRPPKPGQVKVFRALYDYNARSAQEMSFREGDIIYVSEEGPNADWLSARCGGNKGLVPSNYAKNKIGDTALHAASWRGHSECVKLLLERGADPWVLNEEGKRPYDVAKDPETATLIQLRMQADRCNEDEINEYRSDSDDD